MTKIKKPNCENCNDEINGCEECQSFTCQKCGRRVHWNKGCSDDTQKICDDCWFPSVETPSKNKQIYVQGYVGRCPLRLYRIYTSMRGLLGIPIKETGDGTKEKPFVKYQSAFDAVPERIDEPVTIRLPPCKCGKEGDQ